jgi:hypothetical protein
MVVSQFTPHLAAALLRSHVRQLAGIRHARSRPHHQGNWPALPTTAICRTAFPFTVPFGMEVLFSAICESPMYR